MSALQVKCPGCGVALKMNAAPAAGSAIKCPKCGKAFRLAGTAAATSPAAPKKADKVAPAPAPRPKPAAKRPDYEDEVAEKPTRKRPVVDDEDEPNERPARKRRVVDDDEADDRPARGRKGAPKKSGKGKALLVVVLLLFLVCGGAVAGTVWAVNRFVNAASGMATDVLAQMTVKAPPVAEKPPERLPARQDTAPEKPAGVILPGEKVGPGDKPASGTVDVRFVPSDFVAGVVIQPARLLKSPVVTAAVPEEILVGMGADFGIDPRQVERVILLVEPTPGGNVLFFPGGVVRFSAPVDGKAVLGKALKELQEASAEGKTYFTSKTEKMAGTPIAGYVADERTLLIAPEPTLKKMLAAKGDGALARQLQKIDPNSDVAAAFVVEPVRALAQQAAKEAKGELPPDLAEVATLPDRVKAGTLALNLSGDTLLKITLEAENDDSAGVLEKLLGQGKDMLKQAYPDLRKGLAPSLPPELSKDVLDLLDKVPDRIVVSRAGTEVTATLKSPGDLAALARKAAPVVLGPGGPAKPPAAGAEWKTFTSAEHGFTVSFPADPKKTGGAGAAAFECPVENGLIQYTVRCNDQPVEVKPAQVKAVLDGAVAGFDPKTVKSQRDIELKGHPGREVVIEVDNKRVTVVITDRIYITPKRMYQVMVTALKSKQGDAQAKKFFDSFAILEDAGRKPAPPEPAAVTALPLKPLVGRPMPTGESLKGPSKAVMDLTVTPLKLPPKTTLPCLAWADDKGSAFYALDGSGDLRRVSYPDLKEEWKQALGEKCAWLSPSAEGLLVTPADGKEVWLIDPAKGEMKGRFAVAGVKRAASAAGSSLAVISTGADLYLLDLKKGTASRYAGPKPQFGGLDGPVMTADGKYVFTTGGLGLQQLHRWSLAGGQLRLEESSGGVAQGRIDTGATVSPDSKLVCFPSYVGGGAQPPKNYTLSVFRTDDLKKPAFVLDPGGTAIGFDPAADYIYTQDLHLYDIDGKFIKEYKLSQMPRITGMRQILPHPAGGRLLLMTGNSFSDVQVPKK